MVPATLQIGFLTVFPDANGYVGGYLVTNSWGRPIEFRLSTAVQPNRIQQILYGRTMPEYLCSDLIGRSLVEKTTTQAHLIVTDALPVLPLRGRIETPMLAALSADDSRIAAAAADQYRAIGDPRTGAALFYLARFAHDEAHVRDLLERIDGAVDFAEPFQRIREAMTEARKMGVSSRG